MSNKRKGVTLAEMSIVMAVIAIVSLSVVSFVTITSGRGTASIGKLNAMEELELVESFVDQWFAAVAKEESTATDGTKIIIINEPNSQSVILGKKSEEDKVANKDAQLSLRNYVLTIEFPKAGNYSTYRFEKVKELTFEQLENGEDVLYFCTVTYIQDNEGAKQTYIFCINPRVGEIVDKTPNDNTNGDNANDDNAEDDNSGNDNNGNDNNGNNTGDGDTGEGTDNETPNSGENAEGEDTTGGNDGNATPDDDGGQTQ